ncbi:MAG: membrane protein insertase YidC [Proteobacteria bacterium]|nr:membrane protein insertase YidC [Pseudomonadota bacterium]MBU1714187.1 membrane protein insertase YidC [Pseudomonadota bacterium]
METKRAMVAILISMAILVGYQYFFISPPPPVAESPEQSQEPAALPSSSTVNKSPTAVSNTAMSTLDANAMEIGSAARRRPAQDIKVETSRYMAVISEDSGGIKSFRLKDFREERALDSGMKELINTANTETDRELPLYFAWGADSSRVNGSLFEADKFTIKTTPGSTDVVSMTSQASNGVKISRSLSFNDESYLMELVVDVQNTTSDPLQGAPFLSMNNRPFASQPDNSRLFTGPAVMLDGEVEQIKVDDLLEKAREIKGNLGWMSYEDTYFMCSIIPDAASNGTQNSVKISASDNDKVASVLIGNADLIEPMAHKQYHYSVYVGPKKLDDLKKAGHDLEKVVNFGWFDFMAKPALYLLNFFNKYLHNYGVAIILVTILIKVLFWPISQKGMKSMRTMQKIQPKMAKMREKYKDDKERQQKEMMLLYKTYKVNPVGGCLPMILQIPVFFALYRVLMQTIELRHAPFMFWINDLSAPDRLFIGFDLPYLGGLPVLTLLMGASMFLQQKMTPTSGDPTQAKMMMFMPVIFTFMFLNFASGLVLYWLVNNLLSIAQQYVINRQTD